MIVVSATSSKYFYETQQMIYSCKLLLPSNTKFYILDTGLNTNQRKILSERFKFFNVNVIDIDSETSKDPYFKISYKFKAYILDYVIALHGYNHYIWLDAKTNLVYNKQQIIDLCNKQPWVPLCGSVIEKDYTHKDTIKAIVPEDRITEASNATQAQSGGILIKISCKKEMDLFYEFKSYMYNKSILYPEGSSKANHRQDQSVLSCFLFKHRFTLRAEWCSYHNTIHL